jgi:branched-chain amino acid transport system permease protein
VGETFQSKTNKALQRMDGTIFFQTLINGIFQGGVYALVAIGLTLTYGVMMIVNFAHADFLMLGMYVCYWAFTWLGMPPYLTMLIVLVLFFGIGALLQKILIKPILTAPVVNQVLLTLGLSSFIQGAAQFFWNSEPRSLILPYSSNSIQVGELVLNVPRMIAFLVSLMVAVGLYIFLNRSKIGKAIRATSQSRTAAALMGINVDRIYMLVLGIGLALAGLAGALLSPNYPMSPTVGANFSFTAFVIVVLGTMGNFLGAFVGGLIIGIAEAFGGLFIGSELRQLVSMLIFIFVLLLKPGGLFGGKNA